MALHIGSIAPDFEQDSTEGTIKFHQWLGDSWGVLFSHPADFTPVCTTELGRVAKLKPEFEKRKAKVIALSVDTAGTYKLDAADSTNSGVTSTVSNPFTITASTSNDHLVFLTQPQSTTAGASLGTVEVAIEDQYGNTVTSDNDSIAMTLSNGSVTLQGTTTAWVALQDGTLAPVDLASGHVGTAVHVGGRPSAVAIPAG